MHVNPSYVACETVFMKEITRFIRARIVAEPVDELLYKILSCFP